MQSHRDINDLFCAGSFPRLIIGHRCYQPGKILAPRLLSGLTGAFFHSYSQGIYVHPVSVLQIPLFFQCCQFWTDKMLGSTPSASV